MSVYSGFATRSLELSYNTSVRKVLSHLNRFVSAVLRNQPVETEAWSQSFSKAWIKLSRLETQKHQPPKFSSYCSDVAQLCGVTADLLSQLSSVDYSVTQLSTVSRSSLDATPKLPQHKSAREAGPPKASSVKPYSHRQMKFQEGVFPIEEFSRVSSYPKKKAKRSFELQSPHQSSPDSLAPFSLYNGMPSIRKQTLLLPRRGPHTLNSSNH
jgi:hypothetical protein